MRLFADRWDRAALGLAIGGIMLLGAASPAAAFSAKVSGRGAPGCGAASPAFALKGVPRGTASLTLAVRDRDAPDGPQPAPATVPYAGHGGIPKGALDSALPCLPKGSGHRYIWTIHAFDAKGSDLDMTEAVADSRR